MTARQHTDVLPRPSPATALMASLLPARAVAAEAFGDGHDEDWFGQLLPAEARLMAGAGEKRRRDFAGVRVCARRALRTLGHAPVRAVDPDRYGIIQDSVPGWTMGAGVI